jgi:hypothetical protein
MKQTKSNLKEGITVTQDNVAEIFLNAKKNIKHDFKQSFYIQDTYEPKRFLFYKYNKKIGSQKIPIGLCEICDKLEIEHTQ